MSGLRTLRPAWLGATALLAAGVAAAVPPAVDEALTQCWQLAVENPRGALGFVAERLAQGEAAGAGEFGLCRGYAHEQLGNLEAAGAEYRQAVATGEALGDSKLLASALALRGELAYYHGEFSAALEDLDRAYRLELELGRAERQRYVLSAIANVYADDRVAAFDRALEYYRQLLAVNERLGNPRELATSHFNLGSTLGRKGDLVAALAEFEKAVDLDRARGDRDEVAVDERALAEVLVKLGRAREALPRLDAAVARFAAAGDPELLAQGRLTRGIARRVLGDLPGALADLTAASERFRDGGNDRYLAKVLDELAQTHAATGDLAAAFAARSEQLGRERRLAEVSRDEHTSRLRVKFDADKKEQENRALARENELRGQALRDAARIRSLERLILGLAGVLVALLVVLALRQRLHARRLHALAMTDELTRLPNRRSFFAQAATLVADAARGDRPLALVAWDLDHFKRVNDHHGHEVGDHVLRRVAAGARAALRAGDLVGRTGGEEFLVLLPASGASAAVEVAERLRAAVLRIDCSDLAPDLALTVSLGVAVRRPGEADLGELARRADAALYRAKEEGRNRVVVADY